MMTVGRTFARDGQPPLAKANPLLIAEVMSGQINCRKNTNNFCKCPDRLGRPNSVLGSHCFCSVSKRDAKSIALQICGLRFFHFEP
jgi:hypothetical protein